MYPARQCEIEDLIDRSGLKSVLYAIQRVCLDKADQSIDKTSYKEWLKKAGQVATVATKIAD